MNEHSKLLTLHKLAKTGYALKRSGFEVLLKEERNLRSELARLDEMRNAAMAQQSTLTEMQAIGADLLWIGWLARTKARLNTDLARTLAKKERLIHDVRQAHGKLIVIEKILADFEQARKKASYQRFAENWVLAPTGT